MFCSYVPNNFIVYPEILMRNAISQAVHFFSGNFCILVFQALRQVLGGFTYDLKIPNDRVHSLMIPFEMLKIKPGNIFLHSLHGEDNIFQVKNRIPFVRLQMYWTWLRIDFLIRSFSALRVTKSTRRPKDCSKKRSSVKNSQPTGCENSTSKSRSLLSVC